MSDVMHVCELKESAVYNRGLNLFRKAVSPNREKRAEHGWLKSNQRLKIRGSN